MYGLNLIISPRDLTEDDWDCLAFPLQMEKASLLPLTT